MTINTILADLKERHGDNWPQAAVAELLELQEWLAPGNHDEYVALREWCERVIVAGVAATNDDSVAGLVQDINCHITVKTNNASLHRFPDEFVVSKDGYVKLRTHDEAAAVRAFRQAAGMETVT